MRTIFLNKTSQTESANSPSRKKSANGIESESGFTLIEVLISVSIFSIGILATTMMQMSAIKTNSLAQDLTNRSVRAENQMEHLLALPYTHDILAINNNIGIITCPDGDISICPASNLFTCSDGQSYTCTDTLTVTQPVTGEKNITLAATSNHYGQTRNVTLSMLKHQI